MVFLGKWSCCRKLFPSIRRIQISLHELSSPGVEGDSGPDAEDRVDHPFAPGKAQSREDLGMNLGSASKRIDVIAMVGLDKASNRYALLVEFQLLPDEASSFRLADWLRQCIQNGNDEIAEVV